MPQMIGQGRRKRTASSNASNWVLSPISASVTTPVETNKASTDIPDEDGSDFSNDTNTPPPSAGVPCQRSRQTQVTRVTAGRKRHGLRAKYVDVCLGRQASGETTPLRRAEL